MSLKNNFKPAWWLNNPHLQTLWAELMRTRVSIPLSYEKFRLEDGDVLDLVWSQQGFDQTVIFLHGLGGSVHSRYMRGMMHTLNLLNFNTVAFHFRGCTDDRKQASKFFHAGQTNDLVEVVNALMARDQTQKFFAVGFSVGANILLKYLGEQGSRTPLHGAVAISVPFSLKKTQICLSQGFSQIYQQFLLAKLKYTVLRKYLLAKPKELNLVDICLAKNMKHFDEIFTAPTHGFKDALDYYTQASSLPYLASIKIPTLIIHAKDDPFLPEKDIDWPEDISASVQILMSDFGGHVGFIEGENFGESRYWLEEIVPKFFQGL